MHEKQILSSALLNQKVLEKIMELDSDIFHDLKNRRIFDLLIRMYNENQPVSLATVGLEINNTLQDLTEYFLTVANSNTIMEYQIDSVIEKMKEKHEKYLMNCLIREYKAGEIKPGEFREKMNSLDSIEKTGASDFSEWKDKTLDDIFTKENYVEYPPELWPLTEWLGGMFGKNLIYITAKPGGGKTTLAWQIASEKKALFFSLEMTKQELYAKHLSTMTGISMKRILMRRLTGDEFVRLSVAHEKAAEAIKVKYNDDCRLTKIISTIRKEKGKVDLVVIDNFTLIEAHGGDRNERLDNISRSLKNVSGECDIPIIIIVHLKKEFMKDNVRPELDAIYNSGAPAKDGSEIICLWELDGKTMVSILKSRFSGTGDIPGLTFDKQNSRFIADVDNGIYE